VVGDGARDIIKSALAGGERNSLFAGLRAAGGWDINQQSPEVEAFIQADAGLGENINLFAEASAGLDEWQATAGLKWSW